MRVTDTMQAFLANESDAFKAECATALASQWAHSHPGALSDTFNLLWSAHATSWASTSENLANLLIGEGATLDSCRLERWTATVGTGGALSRQFRNATLIECEMSALDLRGCDFAGAWVESVSFQNADLRGVNFSEANLLDVDITGSQLQGANFSGADSTLYVIDDGTEHTGKRALGLLAYRGAEVLAPEPIFVTMAHPHYDIARKIARKMLEGGASQLLGLTQRGASAKDPAAAQKFVDLLVSIGYAAFDRSGAARTVETKMAGRLPLRQLVEETTLDVALASYFGLQKTGG